ncbi:MAG: chromosomal replication initiator protein DnaA [Christensenellaceae bacterium]|nr:chromosomal replication initiator protein DnaA [Christensenellaceae bacterium]
MNLTVIWEDVLARLEKNFENTVLELSFNTYIKTLKPMFEEDLTIYLCAGDETHKDMVQQRFLPILAETFSKAISDATGIEENYAVVIDTTSELELIAPKKESMPGVLHLNPAYTFESFVVGDSNKFAHAASRAVADDPGHTYNPLFIYGGVGLGKTHLMQAIGNSMLEKNPNTKIIYITTESFVSELIEAIRRNNQEAFKRKYRNADLFMMDDIQFISRTTSAKEELFHTFNTLHQAGKQIVISSDKPPEEIPNLEERIVSRLRWGIMAKIDNPDYETRVAILREKLPYIKQITGSTLDVDDEVLHYIASKNDSNIRDLEGALKKVILQAKLINLDKPIKSIDMNITESALSDFFVEPSTKSITPRYIISLVCRYFDITESDVIGKKKNKEIALPRQIAMYFLRDITDLGYKAIGDQLGGRDHSTVMHACEKIKTQYDSSMEMKNLINDIRQKIFE